MLSKFCLRKGKVRLSLVDTCIEPNIFYTNEIRKTSVGRQNEYSGYFDISLIKTKPTNCCAQYH